MNKRFKLRITIQETEDTMSSFRRELKLEGQNIPEKSESTLPGANSALPRVPAPPHKWEIRISPEFPQADILEVKQVVPRQLEFSFLIELRLMELTKPRVCSYCLKTEPNPYMYNFLGRTLCDDCCWEIAEQGGF